MSSKVTNWDWKSGVTLQSWEREKDGFSKGGFSQAKRTGLRFCFHFYNTKMPEIPKRRWGEDHSPCPSLRMGSYLIEITLGFYIWWVDRVGESGFLKETLGLEETFPFLKVPVPLWGPMGTVVGHQSSPWGNSPFRAAESPTGHLAQNKDRETPQACESWSVHGDSPALYHRASCLRRPGTSTRGRHSPGAWITPP